MVEFKGHCQERFKRQSSLDQGKYVAYPIQPKVPWWVWVAGIGYLSYLVVAYYLLPQLV